MKTYSAIWETGGYEFQNIPASDLFKSVPPGFKPTGSKSRLDAYKDKAHDVFKNHAGKKLIVTEDN